MVKSTPLFFVSLLLSPAIAIPPEEGVFGRAIGSACRGTEGGGTCQTTSNCRGISYPQPFCPNDPDNVQCCVEIPCQVGSQSGFCRSVSNNGCAGGRFDPGNHCPGSQDIQCCLKSSTEPTGTSCQVGGQSGTCLSVSRDGCAGGHFDPGNYCPGSQDIQCCLKGSPQPGGSGSVGERVLAKAKTAAGLPYAWGGGSCSGPTHDNPPWQYGEIGFDCSGLVCWAVCQVTGRNLFAAGLRNTRSMYCASEATLGYKKYPYAQRKAGDAVFFGGACSCSNSESIHHVGLVMSDGGDMMWNAPNDQINKVLAMSISGFGERPCPYVIRFT